MRLRTDSSAPWFLILVGTVIEGVLLTSPASAQTKIQLAPFPALAIALGTAGFLLLRAPWSFLLDESGVTVLRGSRARRSLAWKEIRVIQHGLARIYRPPEGLFKRGHWVMGPYLLVVGQDVRPIGIDAVAFRLTDREFEGLVETTVAEGTRRGIPSAHHDLTAAST